MAPRDIKNLDYDPALATALGNMVVAWAYTETIITGALARVTGIDINMAMMGYYRIPTFEARTKFLQALIEEWKPRGFDRDAISKEIAGISGLAPARNGWVHHLWCYDKEDSETMVFDFRKPEENGRARPVKAADVLNHNKAVVARAEKLASLIKYGELVDQARPGPSL